MVNSMLVFSGLSFYLDGFPHKVKQQLAEEIKKGGGSSSYLVAKKNSVLVVPQDDSSNSCNKYKKDQCEKSGVPVVTEDFILCSVSSGRLYLDAVHHNKEYLLQAISEIKAAFKKEVNPTKQAVEKVATVGMTNGMNGKHPLPITTAATNQRVEKGGNGAMANSKPLNGKHSLPATTTKTNEQGGRGGSLGTTNGTKSTPWLKSTPTTVPNRISKPTSSLIITATKPMTSTAKPTAPSTKLSKQEFVVKSSYFKTVGKYTQKAQPVQLNNNTINDSTSTNNTKNSIKTNSNNHVTNTATPDEAVDDSDQLFMMSLFDDDHSPVNTPKITNNIKTSKNNAIARPEADENDLLIMSLFDDEPSAYTQSTQQQAEEPEENFGFLWDLDEDTPTPSIPPPQEDENIEERTADEVELEGGLPYPFFKRPIQREEIEQEATEVVMEEETPENIEPASETVNEQAEEGGGRKEEHAKRKKHRAIPRDAFLCNIQEPARYTRTICDEGFVLVSITGMKEYYDVSFEELRMLSLQSNNRSLQAPALAQGSDMWTWGWTKFGQLGRGSTRNARCAFPTYIPFPSSDGAEIVEQNVQQIACGWAHSVCVTDTGSVASWGRGKGGRLGHPDNHSKRVPTCIDAFTNICIRFVACGMNHSAFVSDKGQLWTVGSGGYGQLGHASFETSITPQLVTAFAWNPVVFVSCGRQNTAAITQSGQLYTWGANSNGQLGYKIAGKNNASPKQVPELTFEVVVHVAIGGKHMAAVSSDGCVWTWGGNDYAQLGRQGWDSCVPSKLPWSGRNKLGEALMVACGESHTVALLLASSRHKVKEDTTLVYTWGRGDLGALGTGKTSISSVTPNLVEELKGKKVIQVACGAHHTAALTARGRLWLWGDNSKYQAFVVEASEISPFPKLVESLLHVTQVACGGYHTSALVSGAAELILQHCKDGNYEQVNNLIRSDPSLIKCVDGRNGYTPIHWACQEGHESVVALLVENGADVNAATPSFSVPLRRLFTPLHVCATSPRGAVHCAQVLTEAPNIKLDLVDSSGKTALHCAVDSNNEEVVHVLVKAGSDKRAVDSHGSTPLHIAVQAQNYRIARYLVRNAAPITVHDLDGKTPLYYSTKESITHELKMVAQNHDVFISYAHSDMTFARKVRMELERNCIKCWMDDQRLEAGSDWRADIGNGILAARLIVFLGSPTSIVSDWCLKELKMGEKNSKLKFVDLSTDELYNNGIPGLVSKLKTTIKKLDKFEFIEKAKPRSILDFAEISRKPFSYISFHPSDLSLVSNLTLLLSQHGVVWVDESMVPKERGREEEGDVKVDVNEGFWIDEKKKEEEMKRGVMEVEAEGNEGIRMCSVFILLVSKQLVDTKDKQIRKHIKYAEQNHKPIVLILKDFPSHFRFSHDDECFGTLRGCAAFHFKTTELKHLSLREESRENIKRVVYVVELLYKETVLAERIKEMEKEKAAHQAEAQRVAEEEAKRKKKFAGV